MRRPLREGRTVHLLDIENLTASTSPTTPEVERVMAAYRRLVPVGPLDQFIAAVSHRALVPVGVALRGTRLLVRSGPDGADSILTETAVADRVDLRFERAVIGSGDGYFADLARWLAVAGAQVTVVTRTGSLSRRLYTATGHITYLDLAA
ncbi:hypothetical protein HII36_16005 [Nonomuraea sp. NN258]|uniref:hypothetical protein n=1 Tax=Nonomuraea antri TaxID=2730852 RepID=UPI00156934EF|nr:hypothetical protein [Nonomuraea antri]NRQ33340.1 hypothetical protein [Nonomuraea antri]